jgi:hypothetical protein
MPEERLGSAASLGRLAWTVIRLPIFALLVILEPVVRLLLAGGALLITLTAIFYGLVRPLPHVPVFGMLGLAVGLFLLLALYYAALRALRA